jgi:hypothetical protein
MGRDTVIQKIRDLLKLQRCSSSEHEAQAAAFAVGKLLSRYQLDLSSVETEDDRSSAAIDPLPLDTFGRLMRWQSGLSRAICDHLGVASWISTIRERVTGRRTVRIMLCGRPEDVEACRSMYSWLCMSAARICASLGHTGKRRNDWLLGFARGVTDQLAAAKRAATEEHAVANPGSSCAIVLAERMDQANMVVEAKHGKIPSAKIRRQRVFLDVYNHGLSVGRSVHLGPTLEQGGKQA